MVLIYNGMAIMTPGTKQCTLVTLCAMMESEIARHERAGRPKSGDLA